MNPPVSAPPAATPPLADPLAAPLVTVVIATRDRPALLRRAVRSVLAQRLEAPLEVVVVCDGGPIDALDDVDAGPHRIRVVANARTVGLAGARNTGIAAAAGAFVAFCDDDDEWLPGKLAAQLPLLDDPATVLAGTGIRIRTATGVHDRSAPGAVTLDDLLRSRITELHPSTFVLRRDDLHGSLGPIDEALPASYGEDYDLLLRAARAGRIRAVPDALAVVHWDRVSFFAERWQGVAAGLAYLLDKHRDFARSAVGSARIEGQIAFAHAARGLRGAARHWALRSLRHDPRQARAYLALAVALRLLSPERVVAALAAHGRGM